MKPALVLAGLLTSANVLAGPVAAVRRDAGQLSPLDEAIFFTDTHVLTRTAEAQAEDFEHLYWVSLADARYDRFSLESLGRVELFEPEAFAVIEIQDSDLDRVGAVLHADRWQCGQLIRLSSESISWPLLPSKAVPLIPIAQKIGELEALHGSVSIESMQKTVDGMVALGTRYGKGSRATEVSDHLLRSYGELIQGRDDMRVDTFAHKSFPQKSVIVRIEGQKYPEQVIVLGSHIDSINLSGNNNNAPGADDNASGTASQLEVLRAIIAQGARFERSIEIHGYALEELGLIGSQEIAQNYKNTGRSVIAMLQNDMNLYKADGKDMIWLVTNDVDSQLTADLEQLAKSYQTIAIGKNRLNGGTSDHRSWTRIGVPAVFPTENPTNYNRRIHTPNDTVAFSGAFTQAAEFSKLTLSFLAHFAGLVTEN